MITTVSATDIQNVYIAIASNKEDTYKIVYSDNILKNGKEVARMVSNTAAISFLSDSLVGVLKNDYNEKEMIQERIEKHESID